MIKYVVLHFEVEKLKKKKKKKSIIECTLEEFAKKKKNPQNPKTNNKLNRVLLYVKA